MMKAKLISLLGTCLILALSSSWLHAKPLLNGLAVSTEFGKERFIAALYSDTLSTKAEDVLNASGHRRMELKVVADSISARSINSMWIEGMAINNAASALEAQAENLAKLNNTIRKRLRAGDILAFDAEPGNGTTVSLNDVTLGKINSQDFFPMLLRTWIGSIPLSSGFKDALLSNGNLDSALSGRYARIQPSDARVEAVSAWVTPAPPRPEVAASSGILPPTPDLAISAPQSSSSSTQAPAEEAEQVAAEEPAPSASADNDDEGSQGDAPAAAKPQTAAAPAEPERQQQRPAPAPKPAVAEEEEEDAEEIMVTAESLLLRQRYVSDVMRQTLQSMRYPRRAEQRRQEGTIRLAVTLSRSGELRDVQIVEESPHSLLNREAMASVERASPFSEIPQGVGEDTFSFAIPMTFRLR